MKMKNFNINKLSFSRILLLLLGTVIICCFMSNMRSIEGLTGCSTNTNTKDFSQNPNLPAYTCPLSNPTCDTCDSRFNQTQCSDYSSHYMSSDNTKTYCLWNGVTIGGTGGAGGTGE